MSAEKRVLITGANKGVGRATVAAVLDADPATFVLLGARDRARGEAARDGLVASNPLFAGRTEVLQVDVSDDRSVAAAALRVGERFGRDPAPLYGIVNNAGIGLGATEMAQVLAVNTYGPKRVCEAFLPLLQADGRVVNVASASGPNYVATCSPGRQRQFTRPDITWAEVEELMRACLALAAEGGDFAAAGLGSADAYGLSKACLIAYTMVLAAANPSRLVNACTPGFIETDLTRPYAEAQRMKPADLGMKPPREGTRPQLRLLLGEPGGTGWYFGSDAERSPIDRYRAPGAPPYTGD